MLRKSMKFIGGMASAFCIVLYYISNVEYRLWLFTKDYGMVMVMVVVDGTKH